MAKKDTHFSNTLNFWRAVELFNLPDIPSDERDNKKIRTTLLEHQALPWEQDEFQTTPPGKKWKHTLYLYCFNKQTIIDHLEKLLPNRDQPYAEPVGGKTCLASFAVDQYGQPVERSYARASFAYGIKMIKEKKKLEDIPGLLKDIQKEFLKRLDLTTEYTSADIEVEEEYPEEGEEENTWEAALDGSTEEEEDDDDYMDNNHETAPPSAALGWENLQKELNDLHDLSPGNLLPETEIICISQQVREKEEAEATFLNSFYLNDLNHLISSSEDLGIPLKKFLCQSPPREIYLLQDQWNLLVFVDPKYQSPGRWPANPAFGLYSGQQTAIHLALSHLSNEPGLLGINGPPGTGKTTLLRDVITDIVVRKAKKLLNGDVNRLFKGSRNTISEYLGYYQLNEEYFGNEGIIVSSNNNGAVENISRELPSVKSIDIESFPDAAYFRPFAERINRDHSWGMISAVLGNADNRFRFINNFWFNSDDSIGMGAYLKAQYDQKNKWLALYENTAEELQSLLKEYEAFQKHASGYHSLLLSLLKKRRISTKEEKKLADLAKILEQDYGIGPENIPGTDFLHLPLGDIHAMTPYASYDINHLRSTIFITSLKLIEYAICYNAKYFNTNLNAFQNMLSGRNPENYDETLTKLLWDSFFFCIPVVSSTLASISRLLDKMHQGSIGWLLLDEAGQATPQSACGAIWRSARTIIIGDTLQIPPVVTIPRGLAGILQKNAGVTEDCWSPHISSVQSLADRATAYGTYITIGDKSIWTGIPLRAHRRCEDPMFSLSNSIAYNNQMVKLTPQDKQPYKFGKSRWIDVRGRFEQEKNVIREEIEALKKMVEQLLVNGYSDTLFIISPFKLVANHCKETFAKYKNIKCGTIHTFQGKEADIVFLVLGSSPSSNKPRDWASSGPNILNVAVTRAKKRIYVIGNKELWGKQPYFNELLSFLK